MDEYATDELTLAEQVIPALRNGMLCMADRFFPSYKLWRAAAKTGADLLWRTRQNARLDVKDKRGITPLDMALGKGGGLGRGGAGATAHQSTADKIVMRMGFLVMNVGIKRAIRVG